MVAIQDAPNADAVLTWLADLIAGRFAYVVDDRKKRSAGCSASRCEPICTMPSFMPSAAPNW